MILLTGFGPFPGVTENPSGTLAESLAAVPPVGLRLAGVVLPVSFASVPGALADFLAVERGVAPRLLLSMGVHPGDGFRLERRARARPSSDKVDDSGEVGAGFQSDRERVTTLDLERLATKLAAVAAPMGGIRVSEDAGGYVCDWTYQQLLQHAERLGVPALFLHVPSFARVALGDQRRLVEQLLALLERAC